MNSKSPMSEGKISSKSTGSCTNQFINPEMREPPVIQDVMVSSYNGNPSQQNLPYSFLLNFQEQEMNSNSDEHCFYAQTKELQPPSIPSEKSASNDTKYIAMPMKEHHHKKVKCRVNEVDEKTMKTLTLVRRIMLGVLFFFFIVSLASALFMVLYIPRHL